AAARIAKAGEAGRSEPQDLRNMVAGHGNVAVPGVLKRQVSQLRIDLTQLAACPARMNRTTYTAFVSNAADDHPAGAVDAEGRHDHCRIPAAFATGKDVLAEMLRHRRGRKL